MTPSGTPPARTELQPNLMQRRSPLHENNQELFDPLSSQDFPYHPTQTIPSIVRFYYLGFFQSRLGLVVLNRLMICGCSLVRQTIHYRARSDRVGQLFQVTGRSEFSGHQSHEHGLPLVILHTNYGLGGQIRGLSSYQPFQNQLLQRDNRPQPIDPLFAHY